MEDTYQVYSTVKIDSDVMDTVYTIPITDYVRHMYAMGWYVSASGLPSGSWEIKHYNIT